ncbi:hypothetical protein CKA32_002418 [Geitlerinema sp. FC II]|nr:hypothetical protein CKA32_002418 [Geitlerinema sp. FC II]
MAICRFTSLEQLLDCLCDSIQWSNSDRHPQQHAKPPTSSHIYLNSSTLLVPMINAIPTPQPQREEPNRPSI